MRFSNTGKTHSKNDYNPSVDFQAGSETPEALSHPGTFVGVDSLWLAFCIAIGQLRASELPSRYFHEVRFDVDAPALVEGRVDRQLLQTNSDSLSFDEG